MAESRRETLGDYIRTTAEPRRLILGEYTRSTFYEEAQSSIVRPAVLAQTKLMTQALEKLAHQISDLKKPAPVYALSCDFCGGNHDNGMCAAPEQAEQVDYMGQQGQWNYSSNFYNPSCGSHPNFSWQKEPHLNQYMPQQSSQPNVIQQQNERKEQPNLENVLSQFIQATQASFKNQEASIRNLETQMDQISKQLAERQAGNLPAETEVNPQDNAIMIKSGKILEGPKEPELEKEAEKIVDEVKESEERQETQPETIALTEECSTIFLRRLPNELKDSGTADQRLPSVILKNQQEPLNQVISESLKPPINHVNKKEAVRKGEVKLLDAVGAVLGQWKDNIHNDIYYASKVLNNMLGVELFEVWGIDFMGPFLSPCSNKKVLATIDYVSKWAEAIPTRTKAAIYTENQVADHQSRLQGKDGEVDRHKTSLSLKKWFHHPP